MPLWRDRKKGREETERTQEREGEKERQDQKRFEEGEREPLWQLKGSQRKETRERERG